MADLFHQIQDALSDRYQVQRELAHGGMARVYLARDPRHHRLVAIKVLHPELANVVGQERFLREIRYASELNHPHILPLLDSGSAKIDQGELPFFVMPYVEGESLRGRLLKEKQLPISEALAIARDVANALAYAHARGVVHRDIKPENILVNGSEAVVADFGIARAIDRSADLEFVTSEGLVVGTPAYMSPEQSSSQGELDGRSDIYSLGCVLYEMLGGDPPFSGISSNAILARHRVDPVPSLRTIRPTVSPAVELVVMRALQKIPADRFARAEQFSAALRGVSSPVPTPISIPAPGRTRRPRLFKPAIAAALTAGVIWSIVHLSGARPPDCGNSPGNCGLDTTRYAILSIEQGDGLPAQLNSSQLLQDAIGRWRGVSLVDPFQVRDALSRKNTGEFRSSDWQKAARDLGAGRYIRGDVRRISNSVRVHAAVYDTHRNEILAEQSVRLGSDEASADSAYAELADRLLFRNAVSGVPEHSKIGTTSAPARQAYTKGYEAVTAWDLGGADSAFAEATRYDQKYSEAFLWLALVRMWSGRDIPAWTSAAERAASGRDGLSSRNQAVSDAILAQSRGDIAGSCRQWERLAARSAFDFVAWYGWADCLREDDAVVSDRRSPTGWRFRGSYHQAFKSYQRAFQLLPSLHRAFRTESFASVRRLLEPGFNDLRSGRALPPDTTTFLAPLSWQGDSLVLFPIPAWKVAQGQSTVTTTTGEAIKHQRQLFHSIAAGWVSAFPGSAEALENLAFSLDVLGDRSALDTLRLAGQLARSPEEMLRVRVAQVWMTLKFSLPAQPAELRSTKRLVDSLLQENGSGNSVRGELLAGLAGLAALTGRASLAARLSQSPLTRAQWQVPLGLAESAPGLLVYASLGGPSDSIRAYERRVRQDVNHNLTVSLREEAEAQWLAFPATLAFPAYHSDSMAELARTGDQLLVAQVAFMRGDTAAVIKALQEMKAKRAGVDPAELSLDALYLEAWLWESMGHAQIAADWLDPTLRSLPETGSRLLSEVFRAGPLARALVLRASVADELGDHATARQWATAVSILWADADQFLQPDLARMRRIAGEEDAQ